MPRYPDFMVLRKRRRADGLSLCEVAKAIGCSAPRLSVYERGWRPQMPKATVRWRELAVKYARLLDEYERKSKGGRSRSKEAKHETHPQ